MEENVKMAGRKCELQGEFGEEKKHGVENAMRYGHKTIVIPMNRRRNREYNKRVDRKGW